MKITFDLPDSLHKRIKEQAEKDRIDIGRYVRKMVQTGMIAENIAKTIASVQK